MADKLGCHDVGLLVFVKFCNLSFCYFALIFYSVVSADNLWSLIDLVVS